jgi:hypothetical protein
MPRWLALTLGCVTALGMQTLFSAALARADAPDGFVRYGSQFLALVLAGYVAGHLVGEWHALSGALAAVLYIFVWATITAVREFSLAREVGVVGLPPINFVDLAVSDVIAMTGACVGGWLSGAARAAGARG